MEIKEIINQVKANPDLLYSLRPREFEELVAEIFAGLGWEVNLTNKSRDGGIDIFAVSTDVANFKMAWIIECKKYSKEHKVGVEQIKQLDYIKSTLNIPNAILATTSSFSKEALQFANSRYDIKLIEFNDIIQRVNHYVPPPPYKESYVENRNFYSCFISYSHKDQEFTNLLYNELKNRNIQVWYAPEDLHPGKKINEEITNAIKVFDKLLIVLSENSMKSEWVQSEIRKSRKREIEEGVRILFPISLVPFSEIQKWELFDADSGKDLAVEIREYYIPDFSKWSTSGSFEKGIVELLRGLNAL